MESKLLTPKQKKLFNWISEIYKDRLIRISNEPYLEHLRFVAEFAAEATPFGYEIGLCHDLLEDTGIAPGVLSEALTTFGYSQADAGYISSVVEELTTHYNKKNFPGLSKKERHRKEDKRIINCGSAAQTVKYGDLIYNSHWTKRYEPRKAQKYLQRKLALLEQLDKGHQQKWQHAVNTLKAMAHPTGLTGVVP